MITYTKIAERKIGDIRVELSVRSDGLYSVYVEKRDIRKGIFYNFAHHETYNSALQEYESLSLRTTANDFLRDASYYDCYH